MLEGQTILLMKSVILASFMLIAFYVSSKSQTSAGIEMGDNYSTVNLDNFEFVRISGDQNVIGGIYIENLFTPFFAIGSGISYIKKSAELKKLEFQTNPPFSNQLIETNSYRIEMSYLEIPVRFKLFMTKSRFSPYVLASIRLALLLTSEIELQPSDLIKKDIILGTGLGVTYRLSRLHLFLQAEPTLGLLHVLKSEQSDIPEKIRNKGILISVGLGFTV
jgi:hypothetical protein